MKGPISKPVNPIQRRFNEICEEGGGPGGGPTRGKVQALIYSAGIQVNDDAKNGVSDEMSELSDMPPWHACYAIGMAWGHLAKFDMAFFAAATRLLSDWNDEDLRVARQFHLERGPDVIEASLRAGNMLFARRDMTKPLPDSLAGMRHAQERWFAAIDKDKPPYMGAWNATALFMVALFAVPKAAAELIAPTVYLPPSGAMFNALRYLFQVNFLNSPPDADVNEEGRIEFGPIATNNGLFADIRRGRDDWTLLDVHSGLYVLGTREPGAAKWVVP